MKKYNSQQEFEAEVVNGIFKSDESIDITVFNLDIEAKIEVTGDIKAGDIKAWDIDARDIVARDIVAWDIVAGNIKAGNIVAGDIVAGDIVAGDIVAWDIVAWDIEAGDIEAGDIDARDIVAGDISYYAVCFAYQNIKVKSITGRRQNAKHFVLDGKLEITKADNKK